MVTVETGTHDHSHRAFSEIREMLHESHLSEAVRTCALQVFSRLAEAEGHVHRVAPEQVHFHEVGAIDSIVDIVGACMALHELEVQAVTFSALPLGTGTVACQHGTYPVPAPATLELLKDFEVVQTGEPHELVTPTGAALLSAWKTSGTSPASAAPSGIGYGFGHASLETRPNVLRAVLYERKPEAAHEDDCLVIESNVDDTPPELLGTLVERLLALDVFDAFTTPVQMKKQRHGTLVTVLCRLEQRDAVLDLLFRESSTFGVREYMTRRTKLARRFEEVETSYGAVRVKVGEWKGEAVTRAPELDDCVRRAEEHSVPVRKVYEAARRAADAS
jgi:hypothetical protein